LKNLILKIAKRRSKTKRQTTDKTKSPQISGLKEQRNKQKSIFS